jgi:Raf kinase inhibitor-like YbhB/YbcL family protein
MRRAVRVAGAALAVTILAMFNVAGADAAPPAKAAAAPRFTLTSPQIKAGANIADAQAFNGFGCQGGNVSPELTWSNPPAGTQSFALMMYDPDAPTGSGWWHWVVYNIPASTTSLAPDSGNTKNLLLPTGAVQGRTDFGTTGYGGPCPPPGKPHRYYLRLYALKVPKLDLPKDATAAFIGFNVRAQVLGSAELMGRYGR